MTNESDRAKKQTERKGEKLNGGASKDADIPMKISVILVFSPGRGFLEQAMLAFVSQYRADQRDKTVFLKFLYV